MKISKVTSASSQENTYFIIAADNECIVVDPSEDEQAVINFLNENGLVCKYVLLTHAHYDHACGAARLQSMGAKIYMHKSDDYLVHSPYHLAEYCGFHFQPFDADKFVEDGESFTVCGIDFSVIHTPGHTAGCVCYVCDDVMFSGDTLFYRTIGRTDLPTGDMSQMRESLDKLFAIKNDYRVLPGHGVETTLSDEKHNNPYA